MTTDALKQALLLLASPSDIVILVLLLVNFLIGCQRGLIRTLLGLFGKLAALLLAAVTARVAAPYMAQYLVTPIVGSVFYSQATQTLQGVAETQGLSAMLQRLLDSPLVKGAAHPLEVAANQASRAMAESLSFVILFCVLIVAFSALIHLIGEALHFLTKKTPLSALDCVGGGLIGLLCGAVLCVLIIWALTFFAPAMFSELGVLSPAVVEQTLLTRGILNFIASVVLPV